MKNKAKILKEVRVYLIITFGLFLHALGWTAFLIPGEIVGGGVSGAAAFIYYATGIPAGYSYLGINGLLILLSIKLLGPNFGIKTVYSVIMVSFFLSVQQKFITEPIITEAFMATVLGGLLGGAGVGIVFSQGGSTGGTDIIAMVINKYKNISPGKIILYCDVFIIGASYFLFESMEKLVYGFVCMGVVAYTIDLILNGSKQSVQIMIFSQQHDKIATKIAEKLDRGITLIDGEGWYCKDHKKVILTVVRKNEAHQINRIVKEIDPNAFVSQGAVMGAYGRGFDEIKD